MEEDRRSKIDWLNEKLNSRTRYRDPSDKRSPVGEPELPDISEKWQTPELDEMLKHEMKTPQAHPFMKKVFGAALVFFIIAVGASIFVFLGGTNFVSSKNVDINVVGPTMSSAGEEFHLGVTISNTNNADLEFANFSIQYPTGSRDPDNTAEALTYTKDELGVIEAGAETIRNIPMVLLGSTGEIKEIKFSVEYKVKGSNATFYKDKIFEVVIGETPIALTIESANSVTSGSNFDLLVTVALNSKDILNNVVLKAEYPHGYTVTGASPQASADDNLWALGDFSPGSKKTVTIHGELRGENREERTFRFYAGVSDGNNASPNIKVVVVSLLNTVTIERPSIGLRVSFNDENVPIYTTPAARPISAAIRFQNNLSEKLYNPRLEATLSGATLDKLSVSAGNGGIYDPGASKVVWNLSNSAGLPELAPGEEGEVTLRFASLPSFSPQTEDSQEIKLNFSIAGVQVGATGQKQVTASESRVVRVSSKINLSSRVLRTLGSFANHGPIPPKAKEETTYTIVWSLGNTQGNLDEAKVTARLGASVSWIGPSSFASGSVSYDAASNVITWNLGTLSAETASLTREQAFQVALTPTIGQIGTTPILVNNIMFTAKDQGTGNAVTVSNPPLTTVFTSDPSFIQGDGVVAK